MLSGGDGGPLTAASPSKESSTAFSSLSATVTLVTTASVLLLAIAVILSSGGGSPGDPSVIPIVGAVGPESFAFDSNGDGPYTGVSDGRIIKWQRNQSRWIDFAVTSPERDGCEGVARRDNRAREHVCGRPLGLCFSPKNGNLYVADAYMGLIVVRPSGGLPIQVATHVQGVRIGLTNSLDIDPISGVIYFTDSSNMYQRRNYIAAIVSGENTGRLMKYDPETKQVSIILTNLKFPNGVSLSKDGDFLVVAETTTCRILKLWLKTEKAGKVETILELPGFPDNIKRNNKGEFWVGIHSKRRNLMKWVLSTNSWVGNALANLPFDITKAYSYLDSVSGYGSGVRINENGNVLEVLDGMSGRRWKHVSEVLEENKNLWIGSVEMPFAIKEKLLR